jgi:ribosomal protein L29
MRKKLAVLGASCRKSHSLRVRRDVADQVILKPIVDQLLAPAVVEEMVKEMRAYYAQRRADAKTEQAKAPAEIEELNQRIARLRTRLKAGDPDMSPDDIAPVIQKVEMRKAELMAAQPEAKQQAKLLRVIARSPRCGPAVPRSDHEGVRWQRC